jgi:hypothetical protein
VKLIDLFAKAITGRSPRSLPKSSRRKPTHGHKSRVTRRHLRRSNVSPIRPRLHGDVATTGRVETASQRAKRKRREQRVPATERRWSA